MKKLLLVSVCLIIAGCLRTRSDIQENEQKKQIQDQVSQMQKSSADQVSRYSDLEDHIRTLNGRIEGLESRLEQKQKEKDDLAKASAEANSQTDKKLALMQETLSKLEAELQQAKERERELAERKAAEEQAQKEISSKKDDFASGEEFFDKKEWKKAILSYQKYREKNAKGKKFSEATYKIGVCFEEMKMKDEARAFYEEVISKFPKTKMADKASIRLKKVN